MYPCYKYMYIHELHKHTLTSNSLLEDRDIFQWQQKSYLMSWYWNKSVWQEQILSLSTWQIFFKRWNSLHKNQVLGWNWSEKNQEFIAYPLQGAGTTHFFQNTWLQPGFEYILHVFFKYCMHVCTNQKVPHMRSMCSATYDYHMNLT